VKIVRSSLQVSAFDIGLFELRTELPVCSAVVKGIMAVNKIGKNM
jgi:hypothetical protein